MKTYGGQYRPSRIFTAEFNPERIFKEEDGAWNYDDYIDTHGWESVNVIRVYGSEDDDARET